MNFKNIVGISVLATLVACSGTGSCPPDSNGGALSLKIEAPAQYPAGLPESINAVLTMTNTSATDANNLKYTIPAPGEAGNYTGVTIVPNAGIGSNSESCINIKAGASCTFTATIGAYANPGSFTVTATPNSSKSSIKQTLNKLLGTNSISVTANLGLVDVPDNGTDFYILPDTQTISTNPNGSTTVMLSLWIRSVSGNLDNIVLVDESGNTLTASAVGASKYTVNSVNTYIVTIPAGVDVQKVRAQGYAGSSAVCGFYEADKLARRSECSNTATINLATSGAGILSVQPSYFKMNESYTTQVVTLVNTGNSAVTNIVYPTISSPFTLVTNSNTCTTTLAAGQSCNFTIQYSSLSDGESAFSIAYKNSKSNDFMHITFTINYTPSHSPAKLQMLLAPASDYSCALNASDNNVYCWGFNLRGELGNGSLDNTGTPTPIAIGGNSAIPVGSQLVAVSAGTSKSGYGVTCVISDIGKLYCWGDGSYGALGNGTLTASNPYPIEVTTGGHSAIPANDKIVYISSNNLVSCALDESGDAYCWGNGEYGQLGNGQDGRGYIESYPVKVLKGGASAIPIDAKLSSISAGGMTVCALDTAGNAYCWGYNEKGELGNGTTTDSNVPVKVVTGSQSAIPINTSITQISVSKDNDDRNTVCAIAAGKAYCWGSNRYGALGNNSWDRNAHSYPESVNVGINDSQLPSDEVVTNIATAHYQTCALADGKAYCWGQNDRGQLGDGTTTSSYVPVAVSRGGQSAIPVGMKLIAVSTAYDDGIDEGYSSCGMANDLMIYCWGDNTYGELGIGTIGLPLYSTYPLQVLLN